MVAHTCNPNTLGGRGRQISEFEASLVYRVSSRRARATQRNPVSGKKKSKNKTKTKTIVSWDCSDLVEKLLPTTYKVLGSIPSNTKNE